MGENSSIHWKVSYSNKAAKQRLKMPKRVQEIMDALIIEIEKAGPLRNNWSNFSSLKGKDLREHAFHCHLKKGRPTYVCCWYILDKNLKKVFDNCFPSRKVRFSREFKISRRSQYRDEHIGETTCFKVPEKITFIDGNELSNTF